MLVQLASPIAPSPLKIGGVELFLPGTPATPEEVSRPEVRARFVVQPAENGNPASLFAQDYAQNRMSAGLALEPFRAASEAYGALAGGPSHEVDLLA